MKKRILLIDADKQLNQLNQKVLLSSGIANELHVASNGKEALEYLTSSMQRNRPLPDIIILDLNLPIMDGFQFIDKFRELDLPNHEKIEIVVFTASSNPKHKQIATTKGIKYYLNKPYILRGLNDIILK